MNNIWCLKVNYTNFKSHSLIINGKEFKLLKLRYFSYCQPSSTDTHTHPTKFSILPWHCILEFYAIPSILEHTSTEEHSWKSISLLFIPFSLDFFGTVVKRMENLHPPKYNKIQTNFETITEQETTCQLDTFSPLVDYLFH